MKSWLMNSGMKNENENVADGDDGYIFLIWGAIMKCYEGWKISKSAA